MTDFEIFQAEFNKWKDEFGLNGYKVYFKEEPIDDACADISTDQICMVATVRLNNKKDAFKDVKKSARHEATHLLVTRLAARARERYTNSSEIYEAEEELVRRIECIIDKGGK